MKRKRRLFGILLIITALIIMQLPVSEADAATSASDFRMEGKKLVEYIGTDTTVSIPDTVEVIGEGAFEGNTDITSVVISDSVTLIEPYAFWGCENLKKVTLGKGLTAVNDFAFANCKGLERMSIPSTVRTIGIQAFVDCVNMTEISIEPEVAEIHTTAFDGCYRLKILCEVGSAADVFAQGFYERQKEMSEYEDINDYEYEDNTEEESVKEEVSGELIGKTQVVGNRAVVFMDNTSMEVLSGNITASDKKEEGDKSLVQGNGEGLSSLPKYTIVEGRIIADQAYYKNKQLKEIILPQGIEEIGEFSFARSSATELTALEGVKVISYGAFYHCDDLTEVVLPDTIENVEPKAFTYTGWVNDFMEEGKEDFLISGGVLIAYRGDEKLVTVPEGVRVIAAEAFAGNKNMEQLILPNSLITIGEGAFENCSHLSVVLAGEKLAAIKDRAFAGCKLENMKLPETVKALGVGAFEDSVQLTYEGNIPVVTYEATAQRLSNEAYRNCKPEEGMPGVTVSAATRISGRLEGAVRSYTLSIMEASDNSDMLAAYDRCFDAKLPGNITVYDLKLTDNSGIPITKLGKQTLQLTIPISEAQKAENQQVFALDRNGQLELVKAKRVRVDGVDCLRFELNYVSQIAIVGTGSSYNGITVLEETVSVTQMAQAPITASRKESYKWALGIGLMALGILCIVWKKKTV